MNITTIVTTIIKAILGMKFGWVILLVVGITVGFSIIKNILGGSFNVAKFAGGFNIFNGSVQGKLIYYFIVFAIVAAVALGIYHRMTQETYENTYTNNIHHNQEVTVDQRQIIEGNDDLLLVGIKLFGLKIGISMKDTGKHRTVIDNQKIEAKQSDTSSSQALQVISTEVKKLNSLSAPFRWVSKLLKKGKGQ